MTYSEFMQNPDIVDLSGKRLTMGFDIETTNIIKRGKDMQIISAYAVMYHWQFSFSKELVVLGRTWQEFENFISVIDMKMNAKNIVWVANLGFEFSFLISHFDVKKVFSKKAWSVLKFRIGEHLEFRDALAVSGGNLKNLAKMYCSSDNQKLSGDLDFKKVRNYNTPLTETEKKYCINDVTILAEFAEKMFELYGNEIPLTKTGILRRETKKKFESLSEDAKTYIHSLMPSKKEYEKVMRYLFQGGYTHANLFAVNLAFDNCAGYDIKSSYPAVMLQEYFPMSTFHKMDLKLNGDKTDIIDDALENNCVYFQIGIKNIHTKFSHSIISEHKTISVKNAIWDNGRLISADFVSFYCTELDYKVLKNFHTWDKIAVRDAHYAVKKKLPEYLKSGVREYFIKKETLKKVGGMDYMLAKQLLNSFYGMTVTKILQPVISFDSAVQEFMLKPNVQKWSRIKENAFLSPYWGIYVTSHARKRLLDMVYEITKNSEGYSDVLYCDTDSIYLRNADKHKKIIESFNDKIRSINNELLKESCFSEIGTFSHEGDLSRFKTLGAKRYLYEKDGSLHATIAGVNGDIYIESLDKEKDSFAQFDMNEFNYLDMNVSAKHAHHYFTNGGMIDVFDGETHCQMECFSGCAIFEIPFEMKYETLWKDLVMNNRGTLYIERYE